MYRCLDRVQEATKTCIESEAMERRRKGGYGEEAIVSFLKFTISRTSKCYVNGIQKAVDKKRHVD